MKQMFLFEQTQRCGMCAGTGFDIKEDVTKFCHNCAGTGKIRKPNYKII
jgi:DnaJ-class molecular chaperone